MITSDCPEGANLQRRRRVVAATAAITAAILGAAGVAATIFAEDRAAPSPAVTVGSVAEPAPLVVPQVTGGPSPPPEPRLLEDDLARTMARAMTPRR